MGLKKFYRGVFFKNQPFVRAIINNQCHVGAPKNLIIQKGQKNFSFVYEPHFWPQAYSFRHLGGEGCSSDPYLGNSEKDIFFIKNFLKQDF